MQVKNIAIIHPSSELYGADRILVEALKTLPESITKIVYLREQGPLIEFLKSNVENVIVKINSDIPIISRKDFDVKGLIKFASGFFKFRKYLKEEQDNYAFKSFYVNTLAATFVLLLIRRFSVKKFIHVHEIIDSPKTMNVILSKTAIRYADLVICVSHAVKNNLIFNEQQAHKIEVLHNGIPQIEVTPLKSLEQPLNFYLFGRIMPKKGQWLFVDELSKLPREVIGSSKFKIVGGVLEGNEHLLDELHAKINGAGLEGCIEILPFCSDISKLMNDASVCLVPSLMKDPFPTTVLESMSAGRMVIASNTGGAKEAIENEESGLLFDPSFEGDLKSKIEKVLLNPNLVTEIGAKASDRFLSKFSTNIFSRNWLDLHHRFQTIDS